MSEKTSVYIVSGYNLLRGMLCSLLSGKGGMEVLGETADGATAYQDIIRMRPQLVLLDINLPEPSGLELTKRILEELPQTNIIVIAEKLDAAWLIEFLQMGGKGYLHDFHSEADISRVIQEVMAGNIHMENTGIRLLVDYACQNKRMLDKAAASNGTKLLSKRERQILHLYARGYNSADIASILFISISTVSTHIRRIREKLNLEHKSELIEYAIRYDLYDDWE